MPKGSISESGKNAEEAFERLVSVAIRSGGRGRGDKRVTVDEKSHYIEIKECGAAKHGSVNQVRPIKYLTLVVHTPNKKLPWTVISPSVIVAKAAIKSRGQHNEIPFECCTIALGDWTDVHSCSDSDLEDYVVKAVREGERNFDLKTAMTDLLRDIRRVNRLAKLDVSRILDSVVEK